MSCLFDVCMKYEVVQMFGTQHISGNSFWMEFSFKVQITIHWYIFFYDFYTESCLVSLFFSCLAWPILSLYSKTFENYIPVNTVTYILIIYQDKKKKKKKKKKNEMLIPHHCLLKMSIKYLSTFFQLKSDF